jgi:hypothetical protein
MHDGKFNIVSTEQKLLFDIRQLLIEQTELLKKLVPEEPIVETKTEAKTEIKIETKTENGGKPCVFCGSTHDNKGAMMACAKKNKNKGDK